MSNMQQKFLRKFPDLDSGNKPLSSYALNSQQAFVCWIFLTLNDCGDHLNHIINDEDRLEGTLDAWADGFRNYTPTHIVNTLQVFFDGKANISNRFECAMPRNIVEFVYEMRTNQHQGATYGAPKGGLALDYDKETARWRDERGNRACMQEAMKCLPSFGALLKKKERHVAEIETEGGDRLDLHRKRKEFYDQQMQEYNKITVDYVG